MRPLFKKNLISVREEQQGVVYYRIDDPSTRTSFKLYEIEYLIAQQCDGARSVSELVDVVKKELNFGVTEDDLKKFIKQMQAMGFMVLEPPSGSAGVAQPVSAVGHATPKNHAQEVERWVREAVRAMEAEDIKHVRDCIAQAHTLAPQDERVRALLGQAQLVTGENKDDYATLLQWVEKWYPHMHEKKQGTEDAAYVLKDEKTASVWVTNGGERVSVWGKKAWFVGVTLVSLGVFLAVGWKLRWFETPVMVEVIALKAARAPAVYSGAAQKIVSREEAWLYPGLEGVVETLPALHEKVEKDTLIATLVMPEAVAKKFKEAHEVYDTTLDRVESFERVLEDLEKKRASLIDTIQEEKEAVKKLSEGPKSFKNLSQVDAKKKHIARYNKMLSALAQQKSVPSNNVKKQRELLEKARVVLEKAKQEAAPYRVYAPFSGTVVDVAAKQGDAVKPETRLLFLADIEATHAVFASENKASMQTGGVVQVILPGEPPLDATVKKTDGQQVTVEIADPKHVLRKRKPEEFFLVREFVEGAFSVPKTAVMKKNNGMFVWLLDKEQETVRAVDVEWLSEEGEFFRVRDLTGTLQDLKHVVVGCAAPCVSIGSIKPGRLVRRAGQH